MPQQSLIAVSPVSQDLLFTPDATFDIGKVAGNRPRDYFGGGSVLAGGPAVIGFSGRGRFTSPVDGVITLYNNAQTDFGWLQFGGTTNAFPALKRNGSQLIVRLADDSGNASLQASFLDASAYVSAGTYIKTQSVTVASLTAATAGAGARSFVTDATATTFMSIVVGGGTNKVPVVSDGTNWLIG